MLWEDIYLSKDAPNDALRSTLAKALGIATNAVHVTDMLTGARLELAAQIPCEVTRFDGDFPLRLSVYLNSAAIKPPSARTVARTLCKELHAKALVSAGTDNPYARLLVAADGEPCVVALAPGPLDASGVLTLKDPSLLWPLERSNLNSTLAYLLEVENPAIPETRDENDATGQLIAALQAIGDGPVVARPDVRALREAVVATRKACPADRLKHPYLAKLLSLAEGFMQL